MIRSGKDRDEEPDGNKPGSHFVDLLEVGNVVDVSKPIDVVLRFVFE